MQLHGSESAPAKANEAGQKNDIGAAKDDISLTATNAKLQGMETAYVENGVSAGDAQNTVGSIVIQAIENKYKTNNKIGKAIISVDVIKTNNLITDDATISISTTDFEIEGTITLNDGILNWGEIENNVPRIKGIPETLSLNTGDIYTISAVLKGTTGDISWNSSNDEIATVENGIITVASCITNQTEQVTITASADDCESKTCLLTVKKSMSKADKINSAIGQIVNYTANGVDNWRVFYADNNTQEMFIIPTKTLTNQSLNGNNKSGKYTNSEDVFSAKNPPTGTNYTYSNVTYGLIYNSKWATALEINGTRKIDLDSSSNPTNRSKATAYLCDPSNWVTYISENAPNGTYAVGAPTKELLALSWEATGHSANWKASDVTDAGYTFNGPSGLYNGNPISTEIKEIEIEETKNGTTSKTKYGLYNNGTIYWLASPSSSDSNKICRINNNGIVSQDGYTDNRGLRPIVSIPMTSVTISETTIEGVITYTVSIN